MNPVALVVYNRPEHLRRVLVELQKHRVEPLYIFMDGPKCEDDIVAVEEVKRVVANISWTVPTVIASDHNCGLAASVCGAADFVLNRHSTVIVLEDDCVPGEYFFDYMTTCLTRYQDIPEIMGVAGHSIPVPDEIRESYPWDAYFAPRAGSWGWGTWKRAWNLHIRDMAELLAKLDDANIDCTQGGCDVLTYADQVLSQGRDIWTPAWILSVYLAGGQYVYPTMSHVKNIGCDSSGMNCVVSNRFGGIMATARPTAFPLAVEIDPVLYKNFREYYV